MAACGNCPCAQPGMRAASAPAAGGVASVETAMGELRTDDTSNAADHSGWEALAASGANKEH